VAKEIMFHVEKHKLHAEKLMFQGEKYKFPVLEHKNKRMAETFVRQTGKKSRTKRKEKQGRKKQ
jgi:hypothetical protein